MMNDKLMGLVNLLVPSLNKECRNQSDEQIVDTLIKAAEKIRNDAISAVGEFKGVGNLGGVDEGDDVSQMITDTALTLSTYRDELAKNQLMKYVVDPETEEYRYELTHRKIPDEEELGLLNAAYDKILKMQRDAIHAMQQLKPLCEKLENTRP